MGAWPFDRRLTGGSDYAADMPVCPACGSHTDDGKAYCEECGKPLSALCASCGASTTPGKRFCGVCGSALHTATAGPMRAPPDATPAPATPVAERRVCSVLFCDLVGFTSLSETRDPEEVRELLSRYFDRTRTVIGRYGGVVEKFIGDAVMAVWGTPSATEEDGERAVRAALDVVDAVTVLGREAGAAGLSARAGVVTGPVAVTLGATGEGMVAGDAVNTAARIQATAAPGEVLVDDSTRRVAEAAVEFSPAGQRLLKGKADPLSLWRAERVTSAVGGVQRIDGLDAGFLGRDAELRLVKELFHACAERRSPRLVSVTGAAGVGKSRLGWEFEKYVDGLADTIRWHRGRCLSYGEGVAFWALAEMVRQRLDIADEDSTAAAADKLQAGLDRWLAAAVDRDYVGPRLAQLLGVEYRNARPELSREELFAGWRVFFERLAAEAPVVMVVEDLQHADVGFLDFLEHVLDWSRDVPIFVLTLARPELEARRPGWGAGRRNSTTLTLDALDQAAMSALLDGLVPGMPEQGRAAISARAEGVPLYAVETVRMLIDRDIVRPVDGVYRLVGDVGELDVPATLQSLLAARLDALEPLARALVADAAVLGGSFPAEALVAVSGRAEAEVRPVLSELVRREVFTIRADPLSPQRGQYAFVQTMFRQVAYETLSRRERKARHLKVAAHLRSTFAEDGEEITEVIAAHFLDGAAAVPDDQDVSELESEAVTMLVRAGERAERTGSPVAAGTAYATAADLLEKSGVAELERRAAQVRERSGRVMALTDSGIAADHFGRAVTLYQRHGQLRDAARATTGLASAYRRLGRLEEARASLHQALTVLEQEADLDTVDALAELATVEAFAGHIDEADRVSAAALAEAQALGVPDSTFADLFIARGLAHVFANRSAQAVASYREAVRRAEAGESRHAELRALINLAEALLTSDPAAASEAAQRAIASCRRLGLGWALDYAMGNLLQALLLVGDWDEAEATYLSEEGSLNASAYSLVLLRSFRGACTQAAPLLSLLEDQFSDTEDPQGLAFTAGAGAALAACEGRQAVALGLAKAALMHADTLGLSAEAIRWSWPLAADAALALGNHEQANELLDWLDDHRPGHIPPVLHAERLRLRARVAATQRDAAAGEMHDVATGTFRKLGSPYHLAVALLDEADHLVQAGRSSDAVPLAAEARDLAGRLKAVPLVRRAERLISPTADLLPATEATGELPALAE